MKEREEGQSSGEGGGGCTRESGQRTRCVRRFMVREIMFLAHISGRFSMRQHHVRQARCIDTKLHVCMRRMRAESHS